MDKKSEAGNQGQYMKTNVVFQQFDSNQTNGALVGSDAKQQPEDTQAVNYNIIIEGQNSLKNQDTYQQLKLSNDR